MDLNIIREKINVIDEQLADLFKERMETVKSVAEYKKEHNKPILDREREQAILDKFLSRDYNEDFKKDLKDFLESIMFISRRSQQRLLESVPHPAGSILSSAGFLGNEGSFSHKALKEYFSPSCKAIGFKDFRDIFEALSKNEIACAIVPVENTSTGGITPVYDLMEEYGCHIIGEKCLRVNQSLLALKDAEIKDIKTVYSHPQALSQCGPYLESHKSWQLIPCHSTSEGVQLVKSSSSREYACIASVDNAESYGLKVLKEGISDDTNHTRFLIISNSEYVDKDADKVSIILSVSHSPGSLYRVLKHFDDNDANMLKIESRPVKGHPWEYNFFIDFTGSLSQEKTQKVLKGIKDDGLSLKLLGNYKGEVTC